MPEKTDRPAPEPSPEPEPASVHRILPDVDAPRVDPETIPQPALTMGSSIDDPVEPPLRSDPDLAKPVPTVAEAVAPSRGPLGATGFARDPSQEPGLVHGLVVAPRIQYSSAQTTPDNPNPVPPSGDPEPV